MVKLVDRNHEWALAIGRAFVAFGSIERLVVAGLHNVPKESIEQSIRSLRLGQRIDLLLELLEGHPGEVFETFSASLKKATKLSTLRNLIAHNPLVLEVYEAGGDFAVKEVIASMHGQQQMTLGQVQQFAIDAEALSAEMVTAALAVFSLLRHPPRAHQS